MGSEADRLREDDQAFRDDLARHDQPPGQGSPCMVVKTAVKTTYPTAAGVFYHCLIETLLGSEVEGTAGTYDTSTRTIKAWNVGAGVPPVGTHVIVRFASYLWVFKYP